MKLCPVQNNARRPNRCKVVTAILTVACDRAFRRVLGGKRKTVTGLPATFC